MKGHKEEKEKNIFQQEPSQKEEINPNKSIEMPQSNKSSEKINQPPQEKKEEKEDIIINEKNNSVKSLTEKEKEKEKEINNINNINNIQNSNNEEDITNIKYVSTNQYEKLKQEQLNKNKNKNLKELNSANIPISIKDLQQNPNKKLIINSPLSLKALYDSGYSLSQLYHKTFKIFTNENKEILHLDEEVKINRYNFTKNYVQIKLIIYLNIAKN